MRHSQTKREATDRPILLCTAPTPDPTTPMGGMESNNEGGMNSLAEKLMTHLAVLDQAFTSEPSYTLRRLDSLEITSLLPEKPPTLMLTEAVIIAHKSDRDDCVIVTRGQVPPELCKGHFPGFPIIPLAALGLLMSQAGALLLTSCGATSSQPQAHLVVEVEHIKLERFRPLRPGCDLTCVATVLSRQDRNAKVGSILVDEQKRPLVAIDSLTYVSRQLERLKERNRGR